LGKSSKDESQSSGATSRPVFISYASHDAAVAQKVCSALEGAGFLCWIAPRNVVPGTMYADGIVHAIDESSILVLILSAQAVASAHVRMFLRYDSMSRRTGGTPRHRARGVRSRGCLLKN
jgi:TIR domain